MKRNIFVYSCMVLIFQSCVVYHKKPVPLIQAVDQGKVKVISPSGQVYKFTNIELRDSSYYGIGREYLDQYAYVSHDGASTPIDTTMQQTIYVKNVRKSKRRTVLLVVGLSIPVAYITLFTLALIFIGF